MSAKEKQRLSPTMRWSSTRTSTRARAPQAPRDQLVRLAGLRDARRMVVGEDHRGRVVIRACAHDFARMDAGAVDGAAEHLLEGDQPVAVVEVQAAEHLVRPVAQLRDQERRGWPPGPERRPGAQRLRGSGGGRARARPAGLRSAPGPARAGRAAAWSAVSSSRSEPNSLSSSRASSTADSPPVCRSPAARPAAPRPRARGPPLQQLSRGRSARGQSRMVISWPLLGASSMSRRRKRPDA